MSRAVGGTTSTGAGASATAHGTQADAIDLIAGMLFISRKTVDRHRANILEKLGMRDRVDLTRYAIRRGLITP